MDKPRALIHYREGNDSYYSSTPGALVIGKVAIPVPVLWALLGVLALILSIFGIATVTFIGFASFIPLLILLGVGALVLAGIVLTMFFGWVAEEIRDASE